MAEAAPTAQSPGARREFMVFRLGQQEFSVDVACVREARLFTQAARIPHAPEYVRGVINLRGIVLPIVDLRARLSLPSTDAAERSVVIVVEHQGRLMGILADAVCDIVDVSEDTLGPAPSVDDDAMRAIVDTVITIGDRVVAIVSPDAMLESSGAERSGNA